mmetsp:Transcript_53890/g.111929  ORF Transcript_53890/g.111929 Transcript_53890/m.111929 type:complete len:204 (+) Transcript_53890:730-1341(+)
MAGTSSPPLRPQGCVWTTRLSCSTTLVPDSASWSSTSCSLQAGGRGRGEPSRTGHPVRVEVPRPLRPRQRRNQRQPKPTDRPALGLVAALPTSYGRSWAPRRPMQPQLQQRWVRRRRRRSLYPLEPLQRTSRRVTKEALAAGPAATQGRRRRKRLLPRQHPGPMWRSSCHLRGQATQSRRHQRARQSPRKPSEVTRWRRRSAR